MASLPVLIAFLAGLFSFLSPCVLPLLPGFLGFLSGMSTAANERRKAGAKSGALGAAPGRLKLFANALAFVLGFTLTFALIGLLLSSVLAGAGYDIRVWLGRIGGLVIIAFGLFTLGILKLPFLEQEYRLPAVKTRYQYLTSALFGISFAVGWSPCVGAVLGGILTLSATDPGGALLPMLAYSAGLGIPFLILGALGSEAIALMKRFRGIWPYFNLVAGILLVVVGVLLATQQLAVLGNLLIPQWLLPYLNGGGL
ncbi:MAG: cytochrome c biogenesis protein CcdA [Lentisphaerota bacterium]